jgi:hypothetical protein
MLLSLIKSPKDIMVVVLPLEDGVEVPISDLVPKDHHHQHPNYARKVSAFNRNYIYRKNAVVS